MCVLLVSVLICKYVSFITCAFIYPYLLSYVCCDDILYTWQVRNDFNKDVYIYEMMHRAWSSIEEVSYCFWRSYAKLQGHTAKKNRRFWPKLGFSGLYLKFGITDGYEMMHKAWNSKGEMPFCFPRSSIKFQGHMGQNITDFDPNWAFPDYRPVAFKALRFALFKHTCLNLFVLRHISIWMLAMIC